MTIRLRGFRRIGPELSKAEIGSGISDERRLDVARARAVAYARRAERTRCSQSALVADTYATLAKRIEGGAA